MPRHRVLISTVIVLVIGLHAVPVLYRSERGTLWPFMQWAMYKGSSPPGPIQTRVRRIIATTAQGHEQEVTPAWLGLSITVLESWYLRPMGTGDSTAAQRLMDRLNRDRNDPIVALRLESALYTVTDSGIVERDNPPVVYHGHEPESR
ncbi:MAG TPA: hypothetical protein VIG08_10810 [Gemmatimonadales bacterium]|jgi:hypothetical protein